MGIDYKYIEIFRPYDAENGRLDVVGQDNLPFEVKRIFWISGVPEDAIRGEHAHRTCEQIIIPISGKFTVKIKRGESEMFQGLSSKYKAALYVPKMHWIELNRFSKDAVCLVLCSEKYDESSYIRNYEEFENELGCSI